MLDEREIKELQAKMDSLYIITLESVIENIAKITDSDETPEGKIAVIKKITDKYKSALMTED
jgi:hypothetical protein